MKRIFLVTATLCFYACAFVGDQACARDLSPESVVRHAEEQYGQVKKQVATAAPSATAIDADPGLSLCDDSSVYLQVNEVLPQMTNAHLERLSKVTPLLGSYVRREKVRRQNSRYVETELLYKRLEKVAPGTHVVVHYTLKGKDRCHSDEYATVIQQQFDAAIDAYSQQPFKAALYDNRDQTTGAITNGLFHVYIHELDSPQAAADVRPTIFYDRPGGGYTASCIGEVAPNLVAVLGANWKNKIPSAIYHEYMHAIQYAYNADMGPDWFREAQAVWAQTFYTPSKPGFDADAYLLGFLGDPYSVCNYPSIPLWQFSRLDELAGSHCYTAGAFMLSAGDSVHNEVGLMRAWLRSMSTTDDAIVGLNDALTRIHGNHSFADLYRTFLVQLYQKKIPHLRSHLIPNVRVDYPVSQLGFRIDAMVSLGGASYCAITPDPNNPDPYLFVKLKSSDYGNPEAILFKSTDPANIATPRAIASLDQIGLLYKVVIKRVLIA